MKKPSLESFIADVIGTPALPPHLRPVLASIEREPVRTRGNRKARRAHLQPRKSRATFIVDERLEEHTR